MKWKFINAENKKIYIWNKKLTIKPLFVVLLIIDKKMDKLKSRNEPNAGTFFLIHNFFFKFEYKTLKSGSC